MEIIYHPVFLGHDCKNHPENAGRLKVFEGLKETDIENGEEYLELIHHPEYIQLAKTASQKEAFLDGDTYTNKETFKTACFAVGASIMAARTKHFGPWTEQERRQYIKQKSPAVIPAEPRRPRPGKEDLEYLPDSPEVLAQTIDAIGYRERIDAAFQEAIRRAKGMK